MSVLLRQILRSTRRKLGLLRAKARRFLPINLGGSFVLESLDIRCLNASDLSAYSKLYKHPSLDEQQIQKMIELMEASDSFCMGVFFEGELLAVGWCIKQWELLGIPGFWFGSDLVAPYFQGRGIGTLLHKQRCLEAKRRGLDVLYANVNVLNYRAIRALERVGFEKTEKPEWQAKIREHTKKSYCGKKIPVEAIFSCTL